MFLLKEITNELTPVSREWNALKLKEVSCGRVGKPSRFLGRVLSTQTFVTLRISSKLINNFLERIDTL